MKSWQAALLVLILLVPGGAFAAGERFQADRGVKEEVVLKSGLTGKVWILETDYNSLTVKGAKGQAKLRADEVDPHCFYNIRRRHMEETAENFILLAIYSAGHGLFNRAQSLKDAALAMDPQILEKMEKEIPDLYDKIADYWMKRAERLFREGDSEAARELAELVATRWKETDHSLRAEALLELLDEKDAEQKAKAEADHVALLDREQKKAREVRQKQLGPVVRAMEHGEKLVNAGMQDRSGSRSRKAFEAAGEVLEQALGRLMSIQKKHGGNDPELDKMIAELDPQIRGEAVSAWIAAGNIEVSKRSLSRAQKYAQRALRVDPNSSRAQSFQKTVQTAAASSGWWGGGGRGGRGGR